MLYIRQISDMPKDLKKIKALYYSSFPKTSADHFPSWLKTGLAILRSSAFMMKILLSEWRAC